MSKKIIIAIDGPAGSGKSTIAKYLATQLNAVYLDTGAMYRAITYLAQKADIVDDEEAVITLTQSLDISLKFEDGITRIFANDEELTDFIRTPEVNSRVSDISRIQGVRTELVKIQKNMGAAETVVAEGRDTTTVVFPEADIKVFLTALLDIRAERRLKEYQEKGIETDFEKVKASLANRDKIDSGRKVSPLTKAEDAFELDTSGISIQEELDVIMDRVKNIMKSNKNL